MAEPMLDVITIGRSSVDLSSLLKRDTRHMKFRWQEYD